jgi:ribonuclease HI
MIPNSILIFTDGSSRGNPGPGGYGAIIAVSYELQASSLGQEENKIIELGGREDNSTNNRMELTAVIEALSYLKSLQLAAHSYKLFSDSSYLINGITKWIHGWQKNGWRTKAKELVENKDLWEKLLELVTIYRNIEWKLIGGHAGHAGNERCDEIATRFADGLEPKLYNGPFEKYPIKNLESGLYDISYKPKKGIKKAGSRAKPYSYVSSVNGVIQTHKTWEECKARVTGKSGTRFKKVFSKEEEESVIQDFKRV